MKETFDKAFMKVVRSFKLVNTDQLEREIDNITRELCQTMQVSRTSVWVFDSDDLNESFIECKSLYKLKDNQYEKGLKLFESDFPMYFAAINKERNLDASDAHTHIATSCLSETYLTPLGINSLFDTPIWKADKVVGILCLEYFDKRENWSQEEEFFIISIADFFGKVFEKHSVLELVESLEQKVLERTEELNQTMRKLNKVQQDLSEKEKLASLGAVVAGVAHELKNPLHMIINSSYAMEELLNKETVSRENAKELLDIITEATIRADRIIIDMLGSSKDVEDFTNLNIVDVISKSLMLSQHFNLISNIDIFEEINAPSCVNMLAAKQKMQRVFINLFENAIYALKDRKNKDKAFKPELKIEVKELEKKVIIKIIDNGEGIPQEMVSKLFDPFFTTKVTNGGTGLGLFLVYNTIREHKGEIHITSNKGLGTTVKIELPK